jgi:hypothetical protein
MDEQELQDIPKWMHAKERSRRVYEWEFSTRKPIGWMTSTAASIVSELIWASADDHEVSISHSTLAARCCCSPNTVDNALTVLVKNGWVLRRNNKGRANGLSLTGEYLNHLLTDKKEVTPEVRDFIKWYHGLQRSQPSGTVKPYGRRDADPKFNSRHNSNAAEIIERCGSLARAKAATFFAVEHKQKAIQTLYNLKIIVCNQPSFMMEFDSFEAGDTTPVTTTPEMDQVTLKRLLQDLREALHERDRLRLTGQEEPRRLDEANNAAATQSMKMGIAPEKFDKNIYGSRAKWNEIYQSQYGGCQ